MSRARRWALLAAVAAAAAPAAAHEVLHTVERGRAVALRAYFADGEPLAYCEYQVFSPADPRIPHQKGRTDRNGWLAFVPDAPGQWRVRVFEATGHGLDLEIDAEAPADRGGAHPAIAFVLRPLAGLAVIVALFAVLFLVQRRRRRAP